MYTIRLVPKYFNLPRQSNRLQCKLCVFSKLYGLSVVTRQSNVMHKELVCDINIFRPFETSKRIQQEQLYQPNFFVIDQSTTDCLATVPVYLPSLLSILCN